MENKITDIEDFKSDNNEEIIIFLNEVLGRKVDMLNWDWEFNTFTNTIFKFIKKNTYGIVATQSMLPVYFLINNQKVLTYKSESSFMHKDFRGQHIFEGLYSKCVEHAFDNKSKYIWGFTPAKNAWKKNFNFNVEQNVISYITFPFSFPKIKFNNRFIKNILKYIIISPLVIINRIKVKRETSKSKMQIIHKLNTELSDLTFLNSKFLKKNDLIGIDLNVEYLNWRINLNPFIKYDTVYFYKKEELVGSIIYSITDNVVNLTNVIFIDNADMITGINQFFNSLCNLKPSHFSYWGNNNNLINQNIFNSFESKMGFKWFDDLSRTLVNKSKDEEKIDSKKWYINALWTEGVKI